MSTAEIEVLGGDQNNWIVRLPGRAYPGVVIQGDSLKILFDLASEIATLAPPSGGLHDIAQELLENLASRLTSYEEALEQHKVGLPYNRPISEG